VSKKDTRQRNSLPSVKNKTLDKELLRRVFSFTEGFLRGTRQRASLSSARKKHSAKNMVLDKEPNSGSDYRDDDLSLSDRVFLYLVIIHHLGQI
jgi:hypothetical protein